MCDVYESHKVCRDKNVTFDTGTLLVEVSLQRLIIKCTIFGYGSYIILIYIIVYIYIRVPTILFITTA